MNDELRNKIIALAEKIFVDDPIEGPLAALHAACKFFDVVSDPKNYPNPEWKTPDRPITVDDITVDYILEAIPEGTSIRIFHDGSVLLCRVGDDLPFDSVASALRFVRWNRG